MQCPFCKSDDTSVIDTRTQEDGLVIKRKRVCNRCQRKFNTYERVDTLPLFVVKKDGSREQYDRKKIERGIVQACHKRNLSSARIMEIVDKIEKAINLKDVNEITSVEIGDIVIEILKTIDQVAYIRFVSVYKDFQNLDEFIDELKKISFVKSNRLEKLIELAGCCDTLIDVGCDHAYIDIEMSKRKMANKIIAIDVKDGPLEKAKENIDKAKIKNIKLMKSNGLQDVKLDKNTTVVIAGMGGEKIAKILEDAMPFEYEKLVLLPHTKIEVLRKFLIDNKFNNTKETLIYDDNKWYNYIVVEK